MSEKLSYEYIKNYIQDNFYDLITEKYINARTKLLIKCPKDHKFEMTFDNFKHGHRCPKCIIIKTHDKQRYSYEYVKEYIENEGYELLSKDYINNKSKLSLRCNKNHIFEMVFNNFKNNKQRCPLCYNESFEQSLIRDDNFLFYRDYVRKLSKRNYKKFKNEINPYNLPIGRGKYHLDHKYSIYQGYVDKIDVDVISSKYNLELLSEKDNLLKHKNCSITKDELLKMFWR